MSFNLNIKIITMNKITIVLFLINTFLVFSQKDHYKITYKTGNYNQSVKKSNSGKMDFLMDKLEKIRKELSYELFLDDNKGIFKQKDIMIPEGKELLYGMASIGVTLDVIYYRDNKIKYKLREYSGERFKIIHPYNQYKWKITKETKIIQGYKCYKAITNWEEYDYARDINLKSSPIAWFTYDLPYSYGPKGLDGLPGVVLEGSSNGVIYFKATKIEKNTNAKFPKIPKGKKIMFTEYSKLIGENFKMKRKRGKRR